MEELIPLGNGTTLCVDSFGDPGAPLALQFEGHMAQLVSTPEGYCQDLADSGFRVVRVDNRDVGRSSRFPGAAYTLEAMVEDVHALIDQLGGAPALVCGRSMGGMVAQLLALTYPQDVAGLGLFFSTASVGRGVTGGSGPSADVSDYPSFAGEDDFVAFELASLADIAGPRYPFDESRVEALARTMWARGVDPEGWARQGHAIATTPDWSGLLGTLDAPATVVHGDSDPILPLERGRDLHDRLPDSRLYVIEGMGHQQPEELDDWFVETTVALAERAGLG
ncbi:MAG: alpha/beta fold hydrolase [Micrococcales bacterium]|nr:alpha/beta fold hydrolase [Micrococcales bacterium]